MPSPIRPADWEHFSIVRESLSLDRLHVAMVGRNRRQLLDYAATLAITLSEQDGWHIEKYDPQRLENLIVDLMLNRFDTALQTVSGHRTSPSPRRPGCVLFIPDAMTISRATFQQLVRLAAGTRDNRLRLVALFPSDSQACEERIALMGTRVARWDLDDDTAITADHAFFAGTMGHTLKPVNTAKRHRKPAGLLAAGAVAAMLAVLAVLPMMRPAMSGIPFELPMDGQTRTQGERPTALAGTLGQDSLPATVKPLHSKESDTDNSQTEQTVRSDLEDAAQAEALRP
jgi:hypothetical protein